VSEVVTTTLPAGSPARRSPFDGHPAGAHPNVAGQTGVRLQAGMLASVTQVSTWISGVHGLEQALAAWLGQPAPALTGETLQRAQGLLMRTGPEEFLWVAEQADGTLAGLRDSVARDVGSVTELSHARCRIRITGDRCLEVLSKLFPVDVRPAAFPTGQLRMTGHHHVPAALHRTGPQAFDIYVFTTYALDQLQALEDAALEYGVAVEV
jgi:heterotetrameric sarcosine oxidase gamma subunit